MIFPGSQVGAFFSFFWPHCSACGTSPTRDGTRAPCSGSTESYPVDCQGSSSFPLYLKSRSPQTLRTFSFKMPQAPSSHTVTSPCLSSLLPRRVSVSFCVTVSQTKVWSGLSAPQASSKAFSVPPCEAEASLLSGLPLFQPHQLTLVFYCPVSAPSTPGTPSRGTPL